MVELKQVCGGYGGTDVLRGVSLTVGEGRVTTLIGPNGCGKTTLLKTIAGQLPFRGELRVNGEDIRSLSAAALARRVAYLPQSKNTPDLTVARMVLHGRFPHLGFPRRYGRRDFEIARAAMERMGIAELAERPLSELSGGMRQNAYIAMALTQQAPVILMDEPTTYLDIPRQLHLGRTVRELADAGKTVLLVLHDLLMALRVSDELIFLQSGETIWQGTPVAALDCDILPRVCGVAVGRTEDGQYYYKL